MTHNRRCDNEKCNRKATWKIVNSTNSKERIEIYACSECVTKLIPENNLHHTLLPLKD